MLSLLAECLAPPKAIRQFLKQISAARWTHWQLIHMREQGNSMTMRRHAQEMRPRTDE